MKRMTMLTGFTSSLILVVMTAVVIAQPSNRSARGSNADAGTSMLDAGAGADVDAGLGALEAGRPGADGGVGVGRNDAGSILIDIGPWPRDAGGWFDAGRQPVDAGGAIPLRGRSGRAR